jgi:Protein of unknown function (DUF3710)
VFRRRRHDGEDQLATFDQGQDDDLPAGPRSGPWDAAADYPAEDRIDCGSLLIPVRDDFDVQINVAQEQGVWVAVVRDDSGMQLQAFAAPRSGGLWDEVRHEIVANIAESGGSCQDQAGPVGTELLAHVPVVEQDQAGEPGQAEGGPSGGELVPVRFIGFDGPRWFLRGVVSGPAAGDPSLGALFDEIFANVVVVRGDHPVPPREQLEIRLPEEARQALEAQFAEENPGWDLPNPFERGPEITETR